MITHSLWLPASAFDLNRAQPYTFVDEKIMAEHARVAEPQQVTSTATALSAVIVDDEQLARDELAFLLKSVGDVNVLAQGKNGVEAVNLVKEHNPDLLFLDVQMPEIGRAS